MDWNKFLNVHGERIFFGGIATVMAIAFIASGLYIEDLGELKGAGITILIGVAMLCYNKARGNGKSPPGETEK